MSLESVGPGVWLGHLNPDVGLAGDAWREFGAQVVVGHPTYGNERTIARLLSEGFRAANQSFGGRRVAFVVADGTWTAERPDRTTADAAVAAAAGALQGLAPSARAKVHVVVTPYEGYGGDATPGKGSALKLIFDELGRTEATMLVLLDGDLRNDMGAWHRVFHRIEGEHRERFPGRPMFITARYARHFVDASLTRFIVGPLTTLMGKYVPGGISGDIALSAEAVAKERDATWTPARRRYGTDIATTFDNVADADTVIYEAYLGAKLHDITDEAKLSVMPAQVIGAALERLLRWQDEDGRVLALAGSDSALGGVVEWGSDRTGIGFVDPGATDVFDIDTKVAGLAERLDDFADDIGRVFGAGQLEKLRRGVEGLPLSGEDGDPVRFLGLDGDTWIEALQRSVAYSLVTRDLDSAMRSLNYLYTAAFLEFVKDRLADLGLETMGQVREAQSSLAVPADRAEAFYSERVDGVARQLALDFFERRGRLAAFAEELGSR